MVSAAIGALPVLSLCLFTTLAIYAGNSDEFSASFLAILRVYLPYVVATIGALGLLALLMTEDGVRRYQAVLAAVAILIWLQGNIFVWDYGVLDGRDIDWLAGIWRGAMDAAIWIVVLMLAISAFRRFGKTLVTSAVVVFAIQSVGAVMTAAGSASELIEEPDAVADSAAAKAIYRFSGDRNVVHIVMDGFQTDIFADLIADPETGVQREDLRGFTLFADNAGVYPYTQLTVPAMLSGRLYRNDRPVEQFIDASLAGPTILGAAESAGYEVDIAAPVALKNQYGKAPHSFAYGIGLSDHVNQRDYLLLDAARLIDLGLFRAVPHFAKPLIYRDELWVFQSNVLPQSYMQMQYFSDLAFLRRLEERMSVDRDAPVYKMMHLMLSHRPTVGNEHCEFDGRRPTNRETVTDQARCGLQHVLAVLRRMQQLGIYDDSLVVLMADHGAWVPVQDSLANDAEPDAISPITIAMAIPVLAVKPPAAKGELQISNAPTSIIDVPATVARILDMDVDFPGIPAFSHDGDATRTRRHLTYAYGTNPDAEGFLFPMQEYEIRGSPFDPAAWQQVATHAPATQVSQESESLQTLPSAQ